jgi:hypothetical protein
VGVAEVAVLVQAEVEDAAAIITTIMTTTGETDAVKVAATATMIVETMKIVATTTAVEVHFLPAVEGAADADEVAVAAPLITITRTAIRATPPTEVTEKAILLAAIILASQVALAEVAEEVAAIAIAKGAEDPFREKWKEVMVPKLFEVSILSKFSTRRKLGEQLRRAKRRRKMRPSKNENLAIAMQP